MTHTQLVRLMLGQLELILGERMVWSAQTGAARRVDADGNASRPHHFGRVGQADISGLIPTTGRRLEVECKTGRGVLSAAQLKFQADVIAGKGLHLVVRDTDWREQLEGVAQELRRTSQR